MLHKIEYTDANDQAFTDHYCDGKFTGRSILFVEDGKKVAEAWECVRDSLWIRVVDRFDEQGRLDTRAIEGVVGFPRSPAHPIFAVTQPGE